MIPPIDSLSIISQDFLGVRAVLFLLALETEFISIVSWGMEGK